MQFRDCKVAHNPPFSYGDCFRACMATLLDDDTFPHVFAFTDTLPTTILWDLVEDAIKQRGRKYDAFKLEELPEDFKGSYFVILRKPEGIVHAVIAEGDSIIHDPVANKAFALSGKVREHDVIGVGVIY